MPGPSERKSADLGLPDRPELGYFELRMVRTPAALDERGLWRAMASILDRFSRSIDRATFLDDCLDAVVDSLEADRGLIVLIGPDGERHPVHARGGGRALDAREAQEVSDTLIRVAHETLQTVRFVPGEESTASESISDLRIAGALAVPLRRRGDDLEPGRGVLYVDFRNPRSVLSPAHTELAEAVAVLIGSVLEQSEQLLRAREDLRDARIRLPGQAAAPSLEELLRPASMEPLRREVMASIRGDSPLLILGESGTGKTLLAQAIAEVSGRTPVVRAMLGASDDLNTITSELFGHERGAFSGAVSRRTGVVEHADGGTLILDEVLNLPMHAQQLLLDFTQFGTFRPLGHARPEPRRARVRIIGATNGDLDAAVRDGKLREDLYYRLAGAIIALPPLRRRREDIPALASGFLKRLDPEHEWTLAVPFRRLLVSQHLSWPGNVRQLEALIRRARERAMLREPPDHRLTLDDVLPRDFGLERFPENLQGPGGSTSEPPAPMEPARPAGSIDARWQGLSQSRASLEQQERALLVECMEKHAGVVARAAREVGMSRTSLVSRLRTLGIDRADDK